MMDVRKQVMATVIEVCADAQAQGLDGWKAIKDAFPGIPTEVIAEAYVECNARETEVWWKQVERTIDVEVLHRAIAAGGGKNDGGNG